MLTPRISGLLEAARIADEMDKGGYGARHAASALRKRAAELDAENGSNSQATMTPEWKTLIYEALRFAMWGAGEGICPAEGEDARSPEDFLFEFSQLTQNEEWEQLANNFLKSEGCQLAT